MKSIKIILVTQEAFTMKADRVSRKNSWLDVYKGSKVLFSCPTDKVLAIFNEKLVK